MPRLANPHGQSFFMPVPATSAKTQLPIHFSLIHFPLQNCQITAQKLYENHTKNGQKKFILPTFSLTTSLP